MATREDTRFEYGETVKVVGTFKTPKTATPPNTNVNPSAVSLKIRRPDKTVETRTLSGSLISSPSTGVYESRIALDQEGTYHWRWSGSNGVTESGVLTGHFDSVREPNF